MLLPNFIYEERVVYFYLSKFEEVALMAKSGSFFNQIKAINLLNVIHVTILKFIELQQHLGKKKKAF